MIFLAITRGSRLVPFADTRRRIASLTASSFPFDRIHVVPSAKQAPEQGHFDFRPRVNRYSCRRLWLFIVARRRPLSAWITVIWSLANTKPEPGVFFAQMLTFRYRLRE